MRNFLIFLVLFGALFQGWKYLGGTGTTATEMGDAEIKALAATVRPPEVLIYTTTECPYCNQAKGWLRQYGFAYEECNLSQESRCEKELQAHDKSMGVPYLIVRGKHLRNGFDTEEFLAALKP